MVNNLQPNLVPASLGGLSKLLVALLPVCLIVAIGGYYAFAKKDPLEIPTPTEENTSSFAPRQTIDLSGFSVLPGAVRAWEANSSLAEIGEKWATAPEEMLAQADHTLAAVRGRPEEVDTLLYKAIVLNSQGKADDAYEILQLAASAAERNPTTASRKRFTLLHALGVTALRRGENENCVMCRGECSCILPLARSAVHQNREGSRLAVEQFTEYLEQFPDDLEVRWLLNLAHMTLGEHPEKVDPRFLLSLDRFKNSEFDIGRFRDVGSAAGVNRFNQAGCGIMDDFDNDGLLDLVTTSWDAKMCMAFYHNQGNGTFKDCADQAGITDQLGGLFCVQTDFNNDGWLDVYVPRGAWISNPIRPTLLRNDRNGRFSDVTEEAGLLDPVNSNSACWADFDNDGWLDVFISCEKQLNRLYRNKGDGTFENVARQAGVEGIGEMCKGANWIDYDNDNYPDLFVNNLSGQAQLFHNDRNGMFSDVSRMQGVHRSVMGFSCWSWDYDNDGWLDLFATCYDRTLKDVVQGILGQPATRPTTKLFRNVQGERFEDVSQETGVNQVFATMGSNFGDFDNDGYLDFYLATGEPNLATLVPNRMFKNVAGKRFAEITGTSGTGHLQKGHGVACGDWDRDGDIDIFAQTGGAVDGDKYHNVLFQNPGQGNQWLTVKLIGEKTNRAAIGARIKVVTAGSEPLTIHRHVTSGSSFGANCLQQTIGLAKADKVGRLEIYWPTSQTTQAFENVACNQAIEITEFAEEFRPLDWKPIVAKSP